MLVYKWDSEESRSLDTEASTIWFACHCINIGQFQTAEPHTTVQ